MGDGIDDGAVNGARRFLQLQILGANQSQREAREGKEGKSSKSLESECMEGDPRASAPMECSVGYSIKNHSALYSLFRVPYRRRSIEKLI